MIAELTEILKLIETNGISIVISCMVTILLYRLGNNYITKLFRPNKVNKNLKEHSIFIQLDYLLKRKIKNIKIECPLRNKICKDFLRMKFSQIQTHTKDLIVLCKNNKLSNVELENILRTNLYSIIESYEKEAIESGIPMVFINKFNEWHQNIIKYVEEMIKAASHSEFISDNCERVSYVLDTYNTAVNMTLIDAEKTLNVLNGELTKETYNGFACQKCKVCSVHKKHI